MQALPGAIPTWEDLLAAPNREAWLHRRFEHLDVRLRDEHQLTPEDVDNIRTALTELEWEDGQPPQWPGNWLTLQLLSDIKRPSPRYSHALANACMLACPNMQFPWNLEKYALKKNVYLPYMVDSERGSETFANRAMNDDILQTYESKGSRPDLDWGYESDRETYTRDKIQARRRQEWSDVNYKYAPSRSSASSPGSWRDQSPLIKPGSPVAARICRQLPPSSSQPPQPPAATTAGSLPGPTNSPVASQQMAVRSTPVMPASASEPSPKPDQPRSSSTVDPLVNPSAAVLVADGSQPTMLELPPQRPSAVYSRPPTQIITPGRDGGASVSSRDLECSPASQTSNVRQACPPTEIITPGRDSGPSISSGRFMPANQTSNVRPSRPPTLICQPPVPPNRSQAAQSHWSPSLHTEYPQSTGRAHQQFWATSQRQPDTSQQYFQPMPQGMSAAPQPSTSFGQSVPAPMGLPSHQYQYDLRQPAWPSLAGSSYPGFPQQIAPPGMSQGYGNGSSPYYGDENGGQPWGNWSGWAGGGAGSGW